MSAVIDLEEKICNFQKELVDLDKLIREKDKEIKKYNNKKTIAKDCLEFNKKNKKYLKNNKDLDHVVNFEEFSQIVEKITEMNEEIEDCNTEIADLTKSKCNLQKEYDSKNNSLKECSKELKNYCKIIEFK